MLKVFDKEDILNLDFGGKSMLLIGDFVQLPSSGWMIFEHLTPVHGTCSNYAKLLRLFVKIMIPKLRNY